jgi:hypothetical protein
MENVRRKILDRSILVVESRVTYIVIFACGLIAHLLWSLPLYSTIDRLLAALLLAVSLGVTYQFVTNHNRTAPLIPLLFFQLYLMYGFAQFSQDSLRLAGGEHYVPSSVAVTTAMVLVFTGELTFLLGYWIAINAFGRARRIIYSAFPVPQETWRRPVIWFALIAVVAGYFRILKPGLIPPDLRNVVFMVANPYVALSIVLLMAFKFRDATLERLALILVPVLSFIGLMSGMMENIVVPVYAFVAGGWTWGRRLNFRWLIASAVIFLVLNPVKANYRNMLKKTTEMDAGALEADRLSKWADAFQRTWNDPFAQEKSTATTAARLSAVMMFAQMVDWVPELVPYKHGDGFLTTVLFMVPRAVWPTKPNISDLVNNRFAVDFRWTTRAGTRVTTFGVFQPCDGYWDFGVLGVVGYMALLGILFGTLFSPRREGLLVDQVMTLVFSCNFFQAASSLFNELASLFTIFAGAMIAMRVLSMVSRRARAPMPANVELVRARQ